MVSLTGFRGFHRDPTSEGRLLFVGCGMLDLERIRVERTSAFRYLWRALAKRTGQSLSLSYRNSFWELLWRFRTQFMGINVYTGFGGAVPVGMKLKSKLIPHKHHNVHDTRLTPCVGDCD